jgi:hypothetical protein
MSIIYASLFQNEAFLCIFPNSFVELMKDLTHLRIGPEDVVHQGKNPLSSFVFISDAYFSSFFIFPFFNGALSFMLI